VIALFLASLVLTALGVAGIGLAWSAPGGLTPGLAMAVRIAVIGGPLLLIFSLGGLLL
jgi:hypothetical protein